MRPWTAPEPMAELARRDPALAALRDDLEALANAVPGLKRRAEPSREALHQAERRLAPQRAVMQARRKIGQPAAAFAGRQR